MADVSHELGSLRHIVDTSLSSKVAMFNKQANQHKENQLLNPFSGESGRRSPKPSFSKDEYGKPLAGSLTEARGQKANIHVLREMLELCQIIDSEGYVVKDEPTMRVIPFGELFNIYNYISDKVVGICLRARKHKLIEFEGEMLFQRRDDDVPIFLLKPIQEIRRILTEKTEEIKRGVSPAPQATSILMDMRSRSASPNVGKGEVKKEETAKVPDKKECVKDVDELTKIEEKIEQIPQVVSIVKEEIATTDQITPLKEDKEDSPNKLNEEPSVIKESVPVPQVTELVIEPASNIIKDEEKEKLKPTIVVNDEDDNTVITGGISEENELSKVENLELISASSSVLEIVEEFVTPESRADENNNMSDEKPNENSNSF